MAYQAKPASSYPACETYFVEDDAGQTSSSMYQAQLNCRGHAQQRQEDMASELSRLTSDEYLEDVLATMNSMETVTLPDVASIDVQEEIQWFMRPFLLDFLVEAHTFFQLLPETLFLAVNLLDRYCSRRVVYKRHYQLVGCAALLIAAKYGDRKERVPTIRELKTMCCSLYDDDMFVQMEWHVLNTLDWIIGAPTVDGFLQISMQETCDYDDVEVEHMAWFLSELALYHKEFVSTRPSVMASASLALARGILQRSDLSLDGDQGHAEKVTLLRLSHHLYHPSNALSRKYASPLLSSSSIRLQTFLAEHAAASRDLSVHSAAPPCEYSASSPHWPAPATADVYNTPQKGSLNPGGFHGYPTPPITPEEEYFKGRGDGSSYAPRRPITPTPSGHSHYPPHVYQQHLPTKMR